MTEDPLDSVECSGRYVLSFQVSTPALENILTDMSIAGKVAEIFDPLGLASPFIVQAKIFAQDLWAVGIRWDNPVTQEIAIRNQQWFSEFGILKEITVPRSLRESKKVRLSSVNTLVDALNITYGAVSYLRCTYDEELCKVSIAASKTKVTPLTPTTTP